MRPVLLFLAAALLCSPARAGDAPAQPPSAPTSPSPAGPVQLSTDQVLKEINTLNAYQAPKLPLKTDQDYAHTVKELEPFHHVEPFKTHFRTQMEYTGPGRALPEPTDLTSVKIGFIGPLYPTVSVATGGKSHEEILGKRCTREACWPSRRRTGAAATARGSSPTSSS